MPIENQWALGAFVAGLLGILVQVSLHTGSGLFLIIALVCGFIGLAKRSRHRRFGEKWFAVVGMLIAAVNQMAVFLT